MEAAWARLAAHHKSVAARPISTLFAHGDRPAEFSATACGFLFDYSKTNIDREGRELLLELAEAAQIGTARAAMFTGEKINRTEGRAVLHTALRALDAEVQVDGQDVMAAVRATHARMCTFAEAVRSGAFTVSGGAVRDVVNIGIGGSDLGPAMACLALAPQADGPRCHFVSNVDGAHVHDVLAGLDPARTLVIVASKTFTTIETMTNAGHVRDWLAAAGLDPAAHLVALSSATGKTAEWGIPPARVFGFEDWVGGRYSVWGPIGLSLMLAIGPARFNDFLAGAAAMDRHFREAPLQENLPVLLALVGIWHNQICGHATRAVLPYDQRLARLPAYLQQLEMESNGKRVAMDGQDLTRHSGPIVWGEPGTNGQHAFYQLLHQGTRIVPAEFLIAARGHEPDLDNQHRLLIANCLAQAQALLEGRSLETAREMMAARGFTGDDLEMQARHRVFPGNRPSTLLVYERLSPAALGGILALYEHRVFVEGVILGINSFDQWGVELGKELALALAPALEGEAVPAEPSTAALVAHLRALRGEA
ncbi:glucose-6-phosphate isomerase [Phaeovulum vinaykumarii]|uniref:glucose-6-phosphate isomerase n=1 Tax=Phaeovulum vinaykumarii TaxID=407234 RepID=UPI0009709D3A